MVFHSNLATGTNPGARRYLSYRVAVSRSTVFLLPDYPRMTRTEKGTEKGTQLFFSSLAVTWFPNTITWYLERAIYNSSPAQVQIAAADEIDDFSVGHASLVHPESAIGVDPGDAVLANYVHGLFDPSSDYVRRFDRVDFHVYYAQADADSGIKAIAKEPQFVIAAEGKLQHDVIAMQTIHQAQ